MKKRIFIIVGCILLTGCVISYDNIASHKCNILADNSDYKIKNIAHSTGATFYLYNTDAQITNVKLFGIFELNKNYLTWYNRSCSDDPYGCDNKLKIENFDQERRNLLENKKTFSIGNQKATLIEANGSYFYRWQEPMIGDDMYNSFNYDAFKDDTLFKISLTANRKISTNDVDTFFRNLQFCEPNL